MGKLNFTLKNKYKTFVAFIHDSSFTFLSFYIALYLRLGDKFISYFKNDSTLEMALIIVVIQQFVFYTLDLYRGIWRYSSMHDLTKVLKAVTITLVITPIAFYLTGNIEVLPRSILLIQWFVMIVLIGGGRFVYRFAKDYIVGRDRDSTGDATFIIGAGSAGEKLVREFSYSAITDYKIVGFIDDDLSKLRRSIHGVPVLGQTKDIKKLCHKMNVKKILIAIPSASSANMRNIVNNCSEIEGVEVKSLPGLKDIASKKIKISQLRDVKPEDLLGREQVSLDISTIGKVNSQKVILVTGAGGSIGSELCNQLCKFGPSKLVLFELSEFALYEVHRILSGRFPNLEIIPYIGDVRDKKTVEKVFSEHQPQIVYHAAAYKHVPLMEDFPYECFMTNVIGTKTVALLASQFDVERFVMVSTDKAVNPTNIMGATKRIAEMVCQDIKSKTKYMTVRFGNVLGSNGSVIPLFREQIDNGGPVTVTHKDITRYFMSIPEASQLIMQAGSMGSGGEIFVLEMGEPVKIYDLARELIVLSGLVPDKDIEIKVTGLRPGEKLYEELFSLEESTLETSHPLVRVACARIVSENLFVKIEELEKPNSDSASVFKEKVKLIVNDYDPQDNLVSEESIH